MAPRMPARRGADDTIGMGSRPARGNTLADINAYLQAYAAATAPVSTYSGGGGGGYSAPAYAGPVNLDGTPATPAAPRMDDDPSFKLFMGEINNQRALAEAERARQEGFTNANRDVQSAVLDAQAPLEAQNIKGGMESRGLFRSGETSRRLTEHQATVDQRHAAIIAQAAQRVSDLQAQLAQQIAQLNGQVAQARVEYAGRGFV